MSPVGTKVGENGGGNNGKKAGVAWGKKPEWEGENGKDLENVFLFSDVARGDVYFLGSPNS